MEYDVHSKGGAWIAWATAAILINIILSFAYGFNFPLALPAMLSFTATLIIFSQSEFGIQKIESISSDVKEYLYSDGSGEKYFRRRLNSFLERSTQESDFLLMAVPYITILSCENRTLVPEDDSLQRNLRDVVRGTQSISLSVLSPFSLKNKHDSPLGAFIRQFAESQIPHEIAQQTRFKSQAMAYSISSLARAASIRALAYRERRETGNGFDLYFLSEAPFAILASNFDAITFECQSAYNELILHCLGSQRRDPVSPRNLDIPYVYARTRPWVHFAKKTSEMIQRSTVVPFSLLDPHKAPFSISIFDALAHRYNMVASTLSGVEKSKVKKIEVAFRECSSEESNWVDETFIDSSGHYYFVEAVKDSCPEKRAVIISPSAGGLYSFATNQRRKEEIFRLPIYLEMVHKLASFGLDAYLLSPSGLSGKILCDEGATHKFSFFQAKDDLHILCKKLRTEYDVLFFFGICTGGSEAFDLWLDDPTLFKKMAIWDCPSRVGWSENQRWFLEAFPEFAVDENRLGEGREFFDIIADADLDKIKNITGSLKLACSINNSQYTQPLFEEVEANFSSLAYERYRNIGHLPQRSDDGEEFDRLFNSIREFFC